MFSLLFMFFTFFIQTQNLPNTYEEVLDQPYIKVAKINKTTSEAYRMDGSNFNIRQVNVDGQGRNIINDAANEPSLVIDPTNPLRMAIGWRQFDTIASNFRQAGVAFSDNGGNTWKNQRPIEEAIFRSDPVLDADKNGNFFYNSLSNNNFEYYCHVFKANSGNDQWSNGIYAYGGDKQWMAIDRSESESDGNIYAFWKSGVSSCNGGFTRSLDRGKSYEACELLPEDPVRGTLVVDQSGTLYACGSKSNGFIVLKSNHPGAEEFKWDEIQNINLGGTLASYDGPNPGGLLGQAWIDVDRSVGTTNGFVYLLATVINNNDPSDIMISRSLDGGLHWEEPIKINDDGMDGNWQWFGSLSIAPNGRIDVTWFDTRDNPDTYISRLYYSYSLDGGSTWSSNEALSENFDPHIGWPQQQKIGDYNHQRSDENGVHLAWAATLNGEQDVFYSYIQPNFVSGYTDRNKNIFTATPNPTSGKITFKFIIDYPGNLSISFFDTHGRNIDNINQEYVGVGNHYIDWNGLNESGLIFYRITLNDESYGEGKILIID